MARVPLQESSVEIPFCRNPAAELREQRFRLFQWEFHHVGFIPKKKRNVLCNGPDIVSHSFGRVDDRRPPMIHENCIAICGCNASLCSKAIAVAARDSIGITSQMHIIGIVLVLAVQTTEKPGQAIVRFYVAIWIVDPRIPKKV